MALRSDPLRLASKLGLLLLTDELKRHKPQYLVGNETPRTVIDGLPTGHWTVRRFAEPPRLVPRHTI